MNLPTGTLLQGGKYRIEGLLGQGGFGITYLAIQLSLQRQVEGGACCAWREPRWHRQGEN